MVVTELGHVCHRLPIGPSFWSVTVGRGPDNEVVVVDPAVSSGRNTLFTYEDGGLWARDLGSTNGTMVNDRRIHNHPLRVGDKVRMGASVHVYFEHTATGEADTGLTPWMDAVLAAPDDMSHRQVFGDWLSQRGDPRGEFIQIQMAAHQFSPDDPRRTELDRRAQALLDSHEARWVVPLPTPVENWRFQRGFIEIVRVLQGTDPQRVTGELGRYHPIRRLDRLLDDDLW